MGLISDGGLGGKGKGGYGNWEIWDAPTMWSLLRWLVKAEILTPTIVALPLRSNSSKRSWLASPIWWSRTLCRLFSVGGWWVRRSTSGYGRQPRGTLNWFRLRRRLHFFLDS